MSHFVHIFYDCTIDIAARELHRNGESIQLSPKVFDCLAYLIEHRDRAVGRDELIAAVWGRVDVSDTLLGQTVLKARRAIGDTGRNQAAIRTIPRFGYRWAAETTIVVPETHASADSDALIAAIDSVRQGVAANPSEPIADVATSATAVVRTLATASPAGTSHRRGRRTTASTVVVLGLMALLVLVGTWRHRGERSPTPTAATIPPAGVVASDNAIAVMPAANTAGDDWSWLRLGLMDFIAHRLRRAGQPVVPSDNVVALTRTSAAGAPLSDEAVRAATGARYLVVPQAERMADGWRVQLALHADGDPRVFEAQGTDAIATAADAADRLLVALGKSPPRSHETPKALSLADLQQRAEAALLSDDFATARRIIETAPPALRDAPELRLRVAQIDFRSGQLDAARTRLQGLLGETTASVDPVFRARILYAIGAVAVREDRSSDAEHAFAEAIALSSGGNSPGVLGQAYTGLAAALVNLGRYDEAAENLAQARVALGSAGDTLALARVDANEGVLDNARARHAEALPVLQRAAERFRRFGALNELFLTTAAEINARLALLDPAAAVAASELVWSQVDQLDNPRSRNALFLQRARALAAVGRIAEAERLLDQLARAFTQDERSGLPGDVASSRAELYLAAGDDASAVDSARLAVAKLPTIDEARERARAWLTLVRALRNRGQADVATTQTRQLSDWASATAAQTPVLYAALARAEQALSAHRQVDAYRDYANALADAERRAVPSDLVEVAASYGAALIANGEVERATTVVGRVARWADRDFACAVLQLRLYRALGQDAASATALTRARSLAGERIIPAMANSSPARGVRAGPDG